MSTVLPRSSEQAPPRLSAPAAVAVSVLAFAAAVGVGHLVAGIVAPPSSPYQAVADAVVRYAPSELVEFGKSLSLPGLPRGQADKVGLLVGIGVVLLVIAIVAGLISREHERLGRRVVVMVGLFGLAAVCTSPVFALADVVAPLASIGAGLWAFRWLHHKALTLAAGGFPPGAQRAGSGRGDAGRAAGDAEDGGHSAESPGEDDPGRPPGGGGHSAEPLTRRNLLVSGAAVGVGAVGAGVGGYLLGAGVDVAASQAQVAPEIKPRSPARLIPSGADFAFAGTPTFITPNKDFYRIDTALRIPAQAAADWSMRIHGMVNRELRLSFRDLLDRPMLDRVVTMTCVSNEVGGNLISTARFSGVSLRDLLVEAGVQPGASQLYSTSLDGFSVGTPMDVVLEPDRDAMLVVGMNGEPLPLEHGYPVRMVVPGLYGFVSATKWLADLEATTWDARQSYWLRRGWARQAPIKTESRIDQPREGDTVTAGQVTAAGIAWAQTRGIRGVEVRLDGGEWQPARLSTEVNKDTWRMWVVKLSVPPGKHTLQARATDDTGQLQTAAHARPIPDGASGYPSISFAAT
jgi:DMSO/TMAO reductase YedYZ molybdopterin-dependent catalytic subunit